MIRYSKHAEKFILSQGKSTALRIYNAVEQLPSGDVKRLYGQMNPPLQRLRVGTYRVIFYQEQGVVTVVKVDTRGDIYKHMQRKQR